MFYNKLSKKHFLYLMFCGIITLAKELSQTNYKFSISFVRLKCGAGVAKHEKLMKDYTN